MSEANEIIFARFCVGTHWNNLNLVPISSIQKRTKHAAHIGETINAYNIFVGKLKEKRPFRNSACSWEESG
jgi:hypothetical protein